MRSGSFLIRHVTAVLSIFVMLAGMILSGQAQAAHFVGMTTTTEAPCHHSLSDGGPSVSHSNTLDHCRELCLTQTTDVAITPAGVSEKTTAVVDSADAVYVVYTATPTQALHSRHASSPPDTRPPVASYPTSQRLLI